MLTVQAMEPKTKFFELSIARRVSWYIGFVDLKLPLLIAGPINPCKCFPVPCIISQIILNFFFSIYMLVQTMWVFAEVVTIVALFSGFSNVKAVLTKVIFVV